MKKTKNRKYPCKITGIVSFVLQIYFILPLADVALYLSNTSEGKAEVHSHCGVFIAHYKTVPVHLKQRSPTSSPQAASHL